MSDIQRYSTSKGCNMFADNQVGEWVWAEDHDKAIQRLRDALIDVGQAPFPLHDHCSKETWQLISDLVRAGQ